MHFRWTKIFPGSFWLAQNEKFSALRAEKGGGEIIDQVENSWILAKKRGGGNIRRYFGGTQGITPVGPERQGKKKIMCQK